jgi:single-stranded DNA-binding protein
VEGTIEQREFTPKDGSKRVVNEIIVRHCHVIAPARGVAAAGGAASKAAVQNGESVPNLDGVESHDDEWPVR